MGADYKPKNKPPIMQDDLILNQANPGTGVIYPLLVLTGNVRIISIAMSCTWTVQPTPLECHITGDVQITHPQGNPVSTRYYIPSIISQSAMAAGGISDSTVFDPSINRPFLYESGAMAIGFEVTGGTVQNLDARIKWALY